MESKKGKTSKCDNINICSININGLNNKLNTIQNLMHNNYIDIMCVQETHDINKLNLEKWAEIYNYTVYINQQYNTPNLKHAKEGTIIIVSKHIKDNFIINEELIYKNRIQILNIFNENENLLIYNCKFFNKPYQRLQLIEVLQKKLEYNKNNVIILGDFNFVENKIDTKNQHLFKLTKDKLAFKKLKEENDFIDIFRENNSKQKLFTYINKKGATRIDRIYINSSLKAEVENFQYYPTVNTDHIIMPLISLKYVAKIRWGKGIYKLNNSLLNLNYVQNEIYNIWQIHKQSKLYFPNLIDWWEKGKLLLKECFLNLSIEVNKSNRDEIFNINSKISFLLEGDLEQNKLEIASLKRKLEKLFNIKNEGARIRSRLKNIENEVPDKFFFVTEKEKGKRNTLFKIKNEKNQILSEPNEILKETKNFYKNLWGIADVVNETEQNTYLNFIDQIKFDTEHLHEINKFINENEIEIAIDSLNSDAAPGSDGLTAQFYKIFKKLILTDLYEVFNNIFLKGKMPKTMREAIVKLLYKKNDHKNIRNWRPISLLNTDYKILSKIIVNRLIPIFENYILPQQCTGLPGRRIENIHYNIQSILEMVNQKNENLAIMSIDFEKAFDKISHQFIFKIMEKLKLGKTVIKFIKLIYKDIFSKIEINGALTKKINIKRGIRQGCPLSMLLFVICTDVLTRKIIKNEKIEGITFQKVNFKIAQYADDTTFAFKKIDEIKIIFNELKLFEKFSGLKVNSEKTQIMATSSQLEKAITNNYPLFKLQHNLKILGITFYLKPENNIKNWLNIIPKIKAIISQHQNRNLTIYGRNQIIKTLLMPLTINIARIYQPTHNIIKVINSIIFKYLWQNCPYEQLARKKLIAEKHEGGIAMIDVESKFDTCFVEKIRYLTNLDKAYYIWHQWSFYNLFYKLRHINQKLYDNFKPHALFGNYNWNKTFNIFLKLKKFNLNWANVTHKEIYLKLKELSSKKTEITSLNKKVIPWNNILCNNKKFKHKINNKERETIYRTAHNAFKWQQNNICKFCDKFCNTIEHILIYCKPIQIIWQKYEKLILKNENIQIELNKDNILFNFFECNFAKLFIIMKDLTFLKMKLIEKKKELDQYPIDNWDNLKFQKYLLEIINTRHKEAKINNSKDILFKT